MDGIHDLGGMHGFGSVAHSTSEPVFRDRWEAAVLALTLRVLNETQVTGREFRSSIEWMDPALYLSTGYYEHVLTGAATLAVQCGLVSLAELEERAGGRFPLSDPPLVSREAPSTPAAEGNSRSSLDADKPRFGVDDRIRVRQFHPRGHTRCPRYVRGKVGVVTQVDGVVPLPDAEVRRAANPGEPVYSVRFAAGELWGDGQEGASVTISLWDSYLEEIS
jgi:nitrile hydratase